MTVTALTPTSEEGRGQWLPIKLAADSLTVSERTVSRWIARGRLRRRYGEDGHVEVWVPLAEADMWGDDAPDARPGPGGHEPGPRELRPVDAVLASQQQLLVERIEALAGRVDAVARANGELLPRNALLAGDLDAVRAELDAVRTLSTRAVRRWCLAAFVLLAVLAALGGVTVVLGAVAAARGI